MKIVKLSQANFEEQVISQPYYDLFQQQKYSLKWEMYYPVDRWNRKDIQGQDGHSFSISFNAYVDVGDLISDKTPSYRLVVNVFTTDKSDENYTGATVQLFSNSRNNLTMAGATKTALWSAQGDDAIKDLSFSEFIVNTLGVEAFDQIKLPHEIRILEKEQFDKNGPLYLRLTKKKTKASGIAIEAMSMEVMANYVETTKTFTVSYTLVHLETGMAPVHKNLRVGMSSRIEAKQLIDQCAAQAKNKGYVDSNSFDYIPYGATKDTWDFDRNRPKKEVEIENNQLKDLLQNKPKVQDEGAEEVEPDNEEYIARSNNSMTKEAQDFSGFFTGQVPEYAANLLGTPQVEASQVKSVFGRASEAIDLVNKFDSSLLSNITFIFNFAMGGAYGVYLSELDRAIKTKALKRMLEQKGYTIEETHSGLTAFPKKGEEKSPEQIQSDIDVLYQDLESKGGTAIGINMDKVLGAAKMDASSTQSKDPNIWQWMAVLHLGGTIVHEAIHAKGNRDEGPSESKEAQFNQWALPIINEKYKQSMESQGKGEEFAPLTIGNGVRHASGKNWYKTAQMSYYAPPAFFETPIGSDLNGRFPRNMISKYPELGLAGWSMMAQQDQGVPIEKRLGRQYMSPLPNDLDQANDVIEEQLRKYTRDLEKPDARIIITELLSEGYDENRGYTTLEGLLDEKRPHPLIMPLKKSASAIKKVATLFGWMNNLSISDGSTIPGLGDRVMAWDDRDEDFSAEEDWIKQQPRYNPSYDIKGFYYRWIDPRLKPELFDDQTRDLAGTSPAKRFAKCLDSDLTKILSILARAKHKIDNGEIPATRFVITQDVVPIIEKVFAPSGVNISVFYLADIDKDESLNSVWIFSDEVLDTDVEKIEKYLQGKSQEDVSELIESIFGVEKYRKESVDAVINGVKKISHEYGVTGVYVSGEYPRFLATKTPMSEIESLDFGGGWGDQIIRIGTALAEQLGVEDVEMSNKSSSVSFCYNGIEVKFSGPLDSQEIIGGLKDRGIEADAFNIDIYNKDFTVNMLIYDLIDDKIKDMTGLASNDLKAKTITTFFEPDYVCTNNPMVILRAIKLHLKHGFEIDGVLQVAMRHYAGHLFDKYSDHKLILARENVLREGRIEGEKVFREFGLDKILDIGAKYASSN